ncbi:LacI family DNA-binding transcriptional regulator [Salipiger mangrovisoli]|uniref:LacI family DNA-binding transcriptional regulator n=1 Tax=Salipiger mangrovisoli TaxID=2865933 RepID=A0ABR9X9I0_9RHOB|nr:LacI family DNA-binding transcriptional regulator [Salipiger mangrovisoli]MBE9640264.1 LacI family DNA-binding transcriptional regulator [Salipiger mangrovisoli]
MSRPTIKDLAREAGVSVATVNRVISGAESVRQSTREIVLNAAENIGFYGLGTIENSVFQGRETHRLAILLQQGHRVFYRGLGNALMRAAEAFAGANISLDLEYLDDLSPDHVASRITALGQTSESLGVVAAEHPMVSDAISSLMEKGVPVSALIGPLSARGNVGYVGHDNWKKGRMAGWAFHKCCHKPGKIGILLGNHRYRNQEINESGFRSYFREHNSDFVLLEPLPTFESAAVAREMTEKLFQEHPDMCGLFVSGGGITGAVAALRERKPGKEFVCVAYELFDVTKAALIDGTITMTLSYPLESFAREIIETMVKAKRLGPDAGAQRVNIPFDVHTSENV